MEKKETKRKFIWFSALCPIYDFYSSLLFFTMNFNVSKTGMHKLHFVTINFQVTLSTLHYDPTKFNKKNK